MYVYPRWVRGNPMHTVTFLYYSGNYRGSVSVEHGHLVERSLAPVILNRPGYFRVLPEWLFGFNPDTFLGGYQWRFEHFYVTSDLYLVSSVAHDLIFNSNGGRPGQQSEYSRRGLGINLPFQPIRDYYIFDGWVTEYDREWVFRSYPNVEYDLILGRTVLYARWISHPRILEMSMGDFDGIVDSTNRTITFNIPSHLIDSDNKFYEDVTHLLTSNGSESVYFIIYAYRDRSPYIYIREERNPFYRSIGENAGFYVLGDIVHVPNSNVRYDLIINVVHPYIETISLDTRDGRWNAQGYINRETRTINFGDVDSNLLTPDFKLYADISELVINNINTNNLVFITARYGINNPFIRTLNSNVGLFANGDRVYIYGTNIGYYLTFDIIDPPLPPESLIHEFGIGGFVGVIDQDQATITVTVPEYALTEEDKLYGYIDILVSDYPTLIFYMQQHPDRPPYRRVLNQNAGFYNGNFVRTASPYDNRLYTLIIEVIPVENRIHEFGIGGFVGVVNQIEETITITVPEYALTEESKLYGYIDILVSDHPTLIFYIEQYAYRPPYRRVLNENAGFYNGNFVRTDGLGTNIVYRLILEVISTETDDPTDYPTDDPTDYPTDYPTDDPTDYPTDDPTDDPTDYPTDDPTDDPTDYPTDDPIELPPSGNAYLLDFINISGIVGWANQSTAEIVFNIPENFLNNGRFEGNIVTIAGDSVLDVEFILDGYRLSLTAGNFISIGTGDMVRINLDYSRIYTFVIVSVPFTPALLEIAFDSYETEEEIDSDSSYETEEESDSDSSYETGEESDSDSSYEPEEESDSDSSYETEEDNDSDSSYEPEEESDSDSSYETEEESDSDSSYETGEESDSDSRYETEEESDSDFSNELEEENDSDSSYEPEEVFLDSEETVDETETLDTENETELDLSQN